MLRSKSKCSTWLFAHLQRATLHRILARFKWVVLELRRRCGASRNRETPRYIAPERSKRPARRGAARQDEAWAREIGRIPTMQDDVRARCSTQLVLRARDERRKGVREPRTSMAQAFAAMCRADRSADQTQCRTD